MQKRAFHIEKLRKITLFGVFLLLLLLATLILLLHTTYIQTKISQFVTNELSEKLNAEIKIENVKLSIFKGFVFKGLDIKDQQDNTLLYIKEFSLIPDGLQIDFEDINLRTIKFDGVFLNIYEIEKDSLNLDYILDSFKNDKEKDTTGTFRLRAESFEIKNSSVALNLIDTSQNSGLNFKDLLIDSLNISFKDIEINNSDISTKIENISFKDKSGFKLQSINSDKFEITSDFSRTTNFEISTNDSKIVFDTLLIDYPDGYNFDEFMSFSDIKININKESKISYNDVKYFIADTSDYSEKIDISGIISGSFNDINIKDLILKNKNTLFVNIDAKIKELPKFDDPSFVITIKDFSSDIEKLREMEIPGKEKLLANIPDQLDHIKNFRIKGISKGKLSGFITNADISGNFGSVKINAVTKRDSLNPINIKGKLSGEEIDLAQVLENKDIGNLTFNQDIDFNYSKNKKISLKTYGKINKLTYKNYIYQDIDLFAQLKDKKIDSLSVYINQNDIKAKLYGDVNFIPDIPEFNLTADIDRANLKNLKLDKDQDISELSFRLDAFFNGINIDDFVGTISLTEPFAFQRDTVMLEIDELMLSSNMTKSDSIEIKEINLLSDIADVTIKSSGKSSEILNSLKKLFNSLFKNDFLEEDEDLTEYNGYFDIEGNIKKTNELSALILPGMRVAEDSKIYGFYDSKKNSLNLSFNSFNFSYNNIIINDFYVIAYTKNNRLYAGTGGSSLKPNESFLVENINLEGDIKNDTINFNLNWNNFKDSANYSADISGIVGIMKQEGKTSYECIFSDSELIMNDSTWKFSESKITIDTSYINIADLTIKNNIEEIYIDGNISKYPGDILYTEFKNFNLVNLLPIIPQELKLEGELNGSATFAQLMNDPLIFTRDSVVKLHINEIDFGNLYLQSNWDNIGNKIHINAYNLKGTSKQFMNDTIYGDYWPDKDSVDLTVDIRSMTLRTFEKYYKEYVGFNRTAYITGKVDIDGNLKGPKLSGDIKLKQATAQLYLLNTINNIAEMNIHFDDNEISLSNTRLITGNQSSYALLKGKFTHTNFSNFAMNIDIDADNFQLMDLEATDTSYFYGTAYGSGNINISGPMNDILLTANISTNKNSEISIPISSSETLEEENSYIMFISDTVYAVEKDEPEQYNVEFGGFSMNMKLDVTPDAKIHIIPDESTGEIFTTGEGEINMIIDKEGDFNMFGIYTISEGEYKFKLTQLRKDFIIKEGGTIEWYGDPADGKINLTAVHSLKDVSLKPLAAALGGGDDPGSSDVDCLIKLSENLLNPDLKLDIEIPQTEDPSITSMISAMPENEKNRHFLALLLIKSFDPTVGEDFTPQTEEILAEQLNNLISQIGNVDLSVDIKQDKLSGENTYGAQYKQKFLDDRIEIITNFGVKTGSERAKQNYVGEFELEAKLNPKGTLRAKVYNKANDDIQTEGEYVQGAGFVWRKKFDSFLFWKKKEEFDSIQIKKEKRKTYKLKKNPQ